MYTTKYAHCAKPMNANRFFDDNSTRDVFMNPWKMKWGQVPSVNVKETKENYTIELAAPGMEKSDFKIEMENDALIISTQKQEEKKNEGERYSRVEFRYSNFKRSFSIPEDVDVEKIAASYENGILNIALPKKEVTVSKDTTKKIEVS